MKMIETVGEKLSHLGTQNCKEKMYMGISAPLSTSVECSITVQLVQVYQLGMCS